MIAVVLVGGLGTRLRPLTDTVPKAMLPIANRPFLERQIDHLAAHGIDRVILACGYQPDAIRDVFRRSPGVRRRSRAARYGWGHRARRAGPHRAVRGL